MSNAQDYALKYQLSDWTLFKCHLRVQVRNHPLGQELSAVPLRLMKSSEGWLLRSIPMETMAGSDASPKARTVTHIRHEGEDLLRYELQRFPRHYIDMVGKDFEAYKAKFSSKTRATMNRRIKKFAEACGGKLRWERYTRPEDIERFWPLARQVSAKTYQERLLDAGLPNNIGYQQQAQLWAAQDRLRAFLLFEGERPVAYLFCPVCEGVVEYAYLGYDPAYKHLSVGTVLQWLALQSLFEEGRFRYFDFTEGDSDHKRLFGTDQLACANVMLLRPTLRNKLLVYSHWRFGRLEQMIAQWAEHHGLKRRIKRWLRFGRGAA